MDWRHHAICRDEDPELFFPIGTSGPALLQVEQAKAVCRLMHRDRVVPLLGARVRSGRRRLGRYERGRTACREAPGWPSRQCTHRLNNPSQHSRPRPHRRWGVVLSGGGFMSESDHALFPIDYPAQWLRTA
nr:hypothetical protein GCM10020092_013870 [Actinoplanes digitatis]